MKIVKIWEAPGTAKAPDTRFRRIVLSPLLDEKVTGISVGIVVLPPGTKSGLHKHPVPETMLVISGRGKVQVGEEIRNVEPEVLIYVPPHKQHQFINDTKEELKVVWIFAPPGEEQEVIDDLRAAGKLLEM